MLFIFLTVCVLICHPPVMHYFKHLDLFHDIFLMIFPDVSAEEFAKSVTQAYGKKVCLHFRSCF